MLAGSITSKPDSGLRIMSGKTFSVSRVRAEGAIAFAVTP